MNILKYSIKKFTITNTNGTIINFTRNFVSVEFYEDLYQPFLSGRVIFTDPNYILEQVPLIGKEDIFFSFQINSELSQFEKKFKNFSVLRVGFTELDQEVESKVKAYVVYFIDKEGITALNEFSKSYKNKLISEIVRDIITNMIGKNLTKIFIESTKGLYSIPFPYMTPVEMIRYVANKYAVTTSIPSQYGFVFYTDITQKCNFTSLNTLMSKTAKYPLKIESKYTNNIDPDIIMERDFEKALEIDNNIKDGLFGNKGVYFDIETKSIVEEENSFTAFKIDNTFLGKKSVYSPDLKDYDIMNIGVDEDYTDKNIMLFSSLDNYNLIVKQEGNFEKKVGQVVKIYLLPYTTDDSQILDNNFSGKWLALRQVHVFDSTGYYIKSTFVKNAFNRKNLLLRLGNVI